MPARYTGPAHGAEELEEALFLAYTRGEEDLYEAPAPETVGRIARLWGPTARARNPQMAAFLAGTRERRSKAYLAAIRRVQRWTTTAEERRRPGPKSLGDLQRLARRGMTLPYRRRGADVRLTAWILISDDCRHRTISAFIEPEDLTPSLDAFERGDTGEAAELFLDALGNAYGVGFQFCEEGVDSIQAIAPAA